jgi:hypothetical protein
MAGIPPDSDAHAPLRAWENLIEGRPYARSSSGASGMKKRPARERRTRDRSSRRRTLRPTCSACADLASARPCTDTV